MKALIATTCLAVLAAIGYFAWGEYGRHLEASGRRAENARYQRASDMMQISGGECRNYSMAAVREGIIDTNAERLLRLCISEGVITPYDRSELERIGLLDKLSSN